MTFQRARQDTQKAERSANILKNARVLCSEFGVMGWSFNELGRRADITKSNLYRYFSNREEILLVLMHEEFHRFAQQFAAETNDKHMDATELSTLLAAFYAERTLLCDLLSVSAAVLEKNLDLEDIQKIKMSGFEDAETVALAIAKALGTIDKEQAERIAFVSGVIVTGLWPMACPTAPAQRLAASKGLERLTLHFRTELQKMLEAQIIGITSTKPSGVEPIVRTPE